MSNKSAIHKGNLMYHPREARIFQPGKESTMKTLYLKSAATCALLVSVPLFAAKFWEKKDFTTWSEQECKEVLNKSPWAFTIGFGNVGAAVLDPTATTQTEDTSTGARGSKAGPGYAGNATFGERESTQFFDFRLLSARPIKAAILQQQVLRNPAIKDQVKQIVNAKPGDQIIIQFEYRTEPPGSSALTDIHRYFLHATLADFRTNTFLSSDKIDQLSVKDYLSPNDKRPKPAFVFPRFNDKGEPYFTGSENSLSFRSQFSPEVRGKKQQYDIFIKMNPKEMWFQKDFAF